MVVEKWINILKDHGDVFITALDTKEEAMSKDYSRLGYEVLARAVPFKQEIKDANDAT